jgi:hypothetical protein
MPPRVIGLAPFIFRYNSGLFTGATERFAFSQCTASSCRKVSMPAGAARPAILNAGFPIRKGSFVIVEEPKELHCGNFSASGAPRDRVTRSR